MKKIKQLVALITVLFLIAHSINAQIPSGFNYQAVVRNNDGSLMKNQFIEVRFTIFNDDGIAFVETYSVNTNNFGLFNIVIGKDSEDYDKIDWTFLPYSLQVEINKGNGFETLGSSLIQSVPYSNLAMDVINNDDADSDPGNELQSLSISNKNLTISDGNTITLPDATSPWTVNSGNVYRSNGNVGIGVMSPQSKLAVGGIGTDKIAIYGTTEETLGTGIAGYSTASTGICFGGRFTSSSSVGRGVYGHAVATSGKNYGGHFVSSSSAGTGVYGYATSTTGTNYGGKFYARGDMARAVYGHASSSSDKNYGGYFKAEGASARGVFGLALSTTGINYGGKFESNSSSGTGVSGYASATNGTNYGGKFESNSSSGTGVSGYASAMDGTNYGGKFEANGRYGSAVTAKAIGNNATAVYGEVTSTTGPTTGGHFKTSSSYGIGVEGQATSTKGKNYGGAFVAKGDKGIGVYGEASSNSDSTNYGGYFLANGRNGISVYGESKNRGGYFKVSGEGGFGIYAVAREGIGVYGSGNEFGGNFFGKHIGILGVSSGNGGSPTNYDIIGGEFSASNSGGSGTCFGIKSRGDDIGVLAYGNDYNFYAAGSGTNYGSSSSKRWKNNIIEIDNPIKKINAIRGVYFDWDEKHGGKHDVGCIAEEVGKVLPEIVVYEKNGKDADGMDYSKLTPLLIEAVKAQQKLIEALTKRVEELEKWDELSK